MVKKACEKYNASVVIVHKEALWRHLVHPTQKRKKCCYADYFFELADDILHPGVDESIFAAKNAVCARGAMHDTHCGSGSAQHTFPGVFGIRLRRQR